MQDDDLGRFQRMWPRLSMETRYRRFHSPVPRLPLELVQRLVHVDHADRDAVVAVVGGEVVGVARYDRSPAAPPRRSSPSSSRTTGRTSGSAASCWAS